ncbi:MAG: hypothetical protein ACFCUS_05580 [Rubrimonas sp.]|uniref:hypothetical protein n=1 Tax=Rubrimonas sp. TaxID=2036015 RepID=UPI002FDEF4B4
MIRRTLVALVLLGASFLAGQAVSEGERSQEAAAALLALEEAELRERMVTALAIAEGLRLRGRTVLVAMTEIDRVRAALREFSPTDPERAPLEARLNVLETRRIEVGRIVDEEFEAYLAIVAELASDLWPRLRRVGGDLEADLRDRRLSRLGELMPILRAHVEEMNRDGALDAEAAMRWRREVDDSYAFREERLRRRAAPEAPIAPPSASKPDEDI